MNVIGLFVTDYRPILDRVIDLHWYIRHFCRVCLQSYRRIVDVYRLNCPTRHNTRANGIDWSILSSP
jgi:hypothetical protein